MPTVATVCTAARYFITRKLIRTEATNFYTLLQISTKKMTISTYWNRCNASIGEVMKDTYSCSRL